MSKIIGAHGVLRRISSRPTERVRAQPHQVVVRVLARSAARGQLANAVEFRNKQLFDANEYTAVDHRQDNRCVSVSGSAFR